MQMKGKQISISVSYLDNFKIRAETVIEKSILNVGVDVNNIKITNYLVDDNYLSKLKRIL